MDEMARKGIRGRLGVCNPSVGEVEDDVGSCGSPAVLPMSIGERGLLGGSGIKASSKSSYCRSDARSNSGDSLEMAGF